MELIILWIKIHIPVLFLSITVIFLTIKNICLQKNFSNIQQHMQNISNENANLLYVIKHDLKVTALAQQRALEVLPSLEKSEQDEILKDLFDSGKDTLEIIEMLSDVNSIDKKNNYKSNIFDLTK